MENPFNDPDDVFIAEVTCELFKNTIQEAKKILSRPKKLEIVRLKELIEFADDRKNFWWNCLEIFCPSIDRKKISLEIKKVARDHIKKLK